MDVLVPLVILPLLYLVELAVLLVFFLLLGKKMTGPRRIATFVTAIPPVVPGIVFVFLFLLSHKDYSDIAAWIVLGFLAAAILAVIGAAIARRSDIAKGVGFGAVIAFIVCGTQSMLPNLLFPSIFPGA